MHRTMKYPTVFLLLLLASTLGMMYIDSNVAAQNNENGTYIIRSFRGGTTNPAAGTYQFTSDTVLTLTATPDTGFEFMFWIITVEDESDLVN